MKFLKSTFYPAAVLFGSTLQLSQPLATADILAYEGFISDGDADVVGLNTGTGFAAPWMDSTGGGTLTRLAGETGFPGYPDNVYFPAPAGGRVAHTTGYNDQSVTRELTTALDFDAEGEYFLSYLWNDSSGADRDNDMRVFVGRAADESAGDPGVRVHIGLTYAVPGYDALGISVKDAVAEPFTSGGQINSSDTFGGVGDSSLYFVVARFQTSGSSADHISARIYHYTPGDGMLVDTSADGATWTVETDADIQGKLNLLGIYAEGAGQPSVDEIRLGKTWADVVNTTPPTAAAILAQPQAKSVTQDSTVTLTVQAAGSAPLSYHWQREVNGTFVNLTNSATYSGVTDTNLMISNAQVADGGNYRVVVSNATGTATSDVAAVVVVGPPEIGIHLHAGIAINGTVGFHYRVDWSSDLGNDAAWQQLTNIASLPSTPYLVYDPTPATEVRRFYRVVLVP